MTIDGHCAERSKVSWRLAVGWHEHIQAMCGVRCLLFISLLFMEVESSSWKLDSERLFRLLKPDTDNEVKASTKLLSVNLIERMDSRRDPPHIDVKSLQKQLGHLFDKDYMSITEPSLNSVQSNFINGRPIGHRPSYLKLMSSTQLQDGSKIKLKVNERTKRKVQNYIWALTMCPVLHTWKNLGNRFWPKWIKEGTCTKKSCSVPPGMKCKPTENTYKTILRWHCVDYNTNTQCRWIPIENQEMRSTSTQSRKPKATQIVTENNTRTKSITTTGFSDVSSTGATSELQDAYIYITVLGVIAGVAITTIIVLCVIYVCRIPFRVRSQTTNHSLFKTLANLKGDTTKDILSGEADTEGLVNIDTPTSGASMQDDLKMNFDYFEIQCRPSDYCTLDVYDNGDAKSTFYDNTKSDHNMSYEEIVRATSSLVKLQQISGSEPMLAITKGRKDLLESRTGKSRCDGAKYLYNSPHQLSDHIYLNHKAKKSKSTDHISTLSHLYSHLHDLSGHGKITTNVYDG
ncbi:Noggin-3 [Bulinus truncatus]|nr:Noggin-3 [Bulinus truncatus]